MTAAPIELTQAEKNAALDVLISSRYDDSSVIDVLARLVDTINRERTKRHG